MFSTHDVFRARSLLCHIIAITSHRLDKTEDLPGPCPYEKNTMLTLLQSDRIESTELLAGFYTWNFGTFSKLRNQFALFLGKADWHELELMCEARHHQQKAQKDGTPSHNESWEKAEKTGGIV